jgi:hypothetical protein
MGVGWVHLRPILSTLTSILVDVNRDSLVKICLTRYYSTTYARLLTFASSANHALGQSTPVADFTSHYAYSPVRPTANYVPRPVLHVKIRKRLHDTLSDTDQGAKC